MNVPNQVKYAFFVFTKHLVGDRSESALKNIERAVETLNIYWVPALFITL